MSLFIDVHALHTLPPSNINRDDTGAPKTATFGGVPRQRVSSQAWKRAVRRDFRKHLPADQLGVRTKRVVEQVVDVIENIAPDWERDRAVTAVQATFSAAGIKVEKKAVKKGEDQVQRDPEAGYLLFLSARQIQRLAEAVVANDGTRLTKREAAALLDTEHSVDIAMFGRMVAEAPDYNVDAAVQVAHAIGVHASEPEFDYFTAVDDAAEAAEESGAGMIGTIQMMSSTLYRYATVDLQALTENLGDDRAATEATVAFVRSFVESMPTGKQNTFANRTLPEVVLVSVREDRPVSYVNAFETPVTTDGERGRRYDAAVRLATEAAEIDAAYDTRPVASWAVAVGDLAQPLSEVGEKATLSQLLDGLRTTLPVNGKRERA